MHAGRGVPAPSGRQHLVRTGGSVRGNAQPACVRAWAPATAAGRKSRRRTSRADRVGSRGMTVGGGVCCVTAGNGGEPRVGTGARKRRPRPEAGPTAVLYARVSIPGRECDGFSIPAQVQLLRDYVQPHGITIVQEFLRCQLRGDDRSTVRLMDASARSRELRVLSTTTFRRIEPLSPVSPSCCEPLIVSK
jgi:hypothetical protein